jgi:ABC-type amino acid transport substrate-binding protein
MRTEDLIVELASRVEPVRPLPSPAVRTVAWLIVAAACVAAGMAAFGLRHGPGDLARSTEFLATAFVAVATVLFGSFSALVLAVPGAERIARASSLDAGVGGAVVRAARDRHRARRPGVRRDCRLAGVLPPRPADFARSSVAARRHGPPRRAVEPRVDGRLAAMAALSTGAVAIQFICPFTDPGHALLGHFGPVIVLGALGALMARRFPVEPTGYRGPGQVVPGIVPYARDFVAPIHGVHVAAITGRSRRPVPAAFSLRLLRISAIVSVLAFVAGCSKPAEQPAQKGAPAGKAAASAASAKPGEPESDLPPPSWEAALPEDLRAKVSVVFTGDLDEAAMRERRVIRAGVTYNRSFYFVDKGVQRGLSYEYLTLFEEHLNKALKTGNLKIHVVPLAMPRDMLIPALQAGRIDLIAAQFTITPERQQLVDFTDPTRRHVNEIVVTGPAGPALSSVDDLSGKTVFARKTSSYYSSLQTLNRRFAVEKKLRSTFRRRPKAWKTTISRDGECGAHPGHRR